MCKSKQITQGIIDKFIPQKGNDVERPTFNKNIRNLETFINLRRENRYLNRRLKIKEPNEDERTIKSLSNIQIRRLLLADEPSQILTDPRKSRYNDYTKSLREDLLLCSSS